MNQHSVFPKRLTIFALVFLLLVLGFSLFSVMRSSKLLNSFNANDVPALQLSCAATRVMGETIMKLNDPEKNRSQIGIQVQVLDDSLREIINVTSDYPELSNRLQTSKSYEEFQKLVAKGELDGNQQRVLTELRTDVQNLVESYLFKKNELIQQNIKYGYLSATVSLVGGIFFFVLIYLIYLSYQKNVENLQAVTKNLEQERLASIQSSKLASLGEMAAGLAHEINNPLAVIIGRTEMLMTDMSAGPVSDFEVSKTVSKISEMATRISKIVSSMRKIAKSSSCEELSQLNLAGVIEDVLNLSLERIKNNSIQLSVSDVDHSLMVAANFTHLSQVIINLINNCIDELIKMPEEQRNIWLKTESVKDFVLLKVVDSGPGVAEELKHKLFEPFFTTKEVGKGTGLGLSISKSLMAEMGGDLSLQSDRGRTAFVLKLRRQKV